MRPRILTGDTPTGRLHLGHWVGSLENRVATAGRVRLLLPDRERARVHDARRQARRDPPRHARDRRRTGSPPASIPSARRSSLQTRDPRDRRADVLLRDAPAVQPRDAQPDAEGRDRATRTSATTTASASRSTRWGSAPTSSRSAPTSCRSARTRLAHIEMCREVARRFDQLYCGVAPTTDDADHVAAGGVFPIPERAASAASRGSSAPTACTRCRRASATRSSSPTRRSEIQKKIGALYTGRQSTTEPGDPNNALFQYVARVHPRSRARRASSRIATRAATTSATARSRPRSRRDRRAGRADARAPRARSTAPRGERADRSRSSARTPAKANAVADETLATAKAGDEARLRSAQALVLI